MVEEFGKKEINSMHYPIRSLKQRYVLRALLLACCLLLSGCATVQVASPDIDLASKTVTPPADTNEDGRITMGEMKAWLNDQVPYMARRLTGNEQQPVMLGKDQDELVVLTR